MLSKIEYLEGCADIIDKLKRRVGYCRSGLLIEYLPTKKEMPFYMVLVKLLGDCENALDAICLAYGNLALHSENGGDSV